MASNNPQTALYVGLKKGAEFFVGKMFDRIDSNGLPKVIKDATSIDEPIIHDKGGSIDVVIDLEEAPMAVAFEYGSGVHGDEGEKYRIPKEGGASHVAIPRDRWKAYQPPPDRDPLVFVKVMHPGVRERPYIRPTINENRKEIAKIIGREFVESITVRGTTIIK